VPLSILRHPIAGDIVTMPRPSPCPLFDLTLTAKLILSVQFPRSNTPGAPETAEADDALPNDRVRQANRYRVAEASE
jgi:hypothetical protein